MIYKFVILILLFLNYSFWSLDIGDLGLATSLGLLFFILFWVKKFNKKRYRYNKLLDLESFFVTFFYVFHYGYISLYILGFSDYDKEVFYDKEALLNALYFCNLCILAFCFSYALFFKKNRLQQTDSLSSERYETLLNCKKISIYILTLAVVMFWLPILTSFSEVLASYKFLINIGQNSSIGKLFWLAQYLGYISIALYLSVTIGEKSPRRSKPESLVLYFFIFGFLLIGDRGGFLSFFMMVALASVFSQRKRSIKGVYFVLVLVIFLSPIIAELRINGVQNFNVVDSLFENNLLVLMLEEFGTTLKTVVIAIFYVPENHGYWLGTSFLDSIAVVIPNLFGERTASDIGKFVTEVAFGPLDSTYGRGGSIAMEAYLNFGYFGVSLFLVYGAYLKFISEMSTKRNNLIWRVAFFSTAAAFSMWMRNTSTTSFRIILWSIIFSYIVLLFSRAVTRSKKTKNDFSSSQ